MLRKRRYRPAQLLAAGLPHRPEVVELDALRPGSDLDAMLEWTAAQPDEYRQLAWVGHSPDVCRLAAALIGTPAAWVRFAKGATAFIRFHGRAEIGRGELRWLVTAKTLGC